MDDINKLIKNIKDTRRKLTQEIDCLAGGDELAGDKFTGSNPDEKSVWAVSFISKQKELDILRSVIAKKDQESHEASLKLKTLEYRVANDHLVWQDRLRLKEEEHKVRLLTLENQNEYLRNENSNIKESFQRQIEDIKSQKRSVENDLLELRTKHSELEKEYFRLKSNLAQLESKPAGQHPQ